MPSVFTLDKTLDDICTEYDYGIVSGSVTVFIRDSVENYGRFELTILEGILLIIDAFEDGFMITQCTPLFDTPTISDSLKLVQDQLEKKYDTLNKLLLTISPHFSQRYWDKIQTITPTLTDLYDSTMPAMGSPSLQLQQQSTSSSTENTENDIFEWLN
ncbi:hypothetical protein BCR42DRAFT_403566 [Absidia repens]|uniref:GSKIP domain-containing protein n=1 Tax=Absidia repens TaxID=90262 RepID=A0A1X2IZM0_9FUNG|nr:hypothetical protein BCR42DRAFT_403566 [Absidia repens]